MKSTDDFFALLAIGLHNDVQNTDFSEVNWKEIIELGVKHGVVGQIFYAVKRLKEGNIADGNIIIDSLDLGQLFTLANKQETSFDRMWNNTVKLADLFTNNKIRTVIIKGFGIASLYPNPRSRYFCDTDCFLLPKDSISFNLNDNEEVWNKANSLIESKNIIVSKGVYLHSTFNYNELHVENHRFLTNIKGSKRMYEFEKYLRLSLLNDGTSILGNTNVEIPNLMFTALYVLYHSHKHMLHGEMTLRMLCDWAVILKEGAKKGFDWKELLYISHKFGFLRFAVAMTGLAGIICCAPLPLDFQNDTNADAVLLKYIMNPVTKVNHYSMKWLARLNHLYLTFKARERYKEFSDMSSFQATAQIIMGRLKEY